MNKDVENSIPQDQSSLEEQKKSQLEPELPTIYAPRAAWMEFLLTFFTFTLSTPFWFVARVRELKRMSNSEHTPWLWFFVAFSPVVQFFALPKLTDVIDDACDEHDAKSLGGWKFFIFISIVGATIYSNVMDKIELPFWGFFIGILFYSLAIAALQYRLNALKASLQGVQFLGVKFGYKVWEWLLLVFGVPITLLTIYFTVIVPILMTVEPIQKGTTITAANESYQLRILEDGWSNAEIGTYSDGSADLELKGPFLDMNFIVFSHGFDETLNSVSYWRQGQIVEEAGDSKCSHTRTFEGDSLKVGALVICSGSSMGDPEISISRVIHTDKGLYEIYGYFTSSKITFKRHKDVFIDTAKGFKSL